MNGSLKLYRIKPIFKIPQNIELPTCMYKMRNPVACVTDSNKKKKSFDEKEVLNNIMDKAPIPELESVEKKWDLVIDKLSELKSQVNDMKKTVGETCKLVNYTLVDHDILNNLKVFQGAVINASPSNPPYFLFLIKHLYKSSIPMLLSIYTHSNVSDLPDHLNYFNEFNKECNNNGLKLYLIWKNDLLDTELIINPVKQLPIKGEVNILRYLAQSGLDLLQYPKADFLETVKADEILDKCHVLRHASTPMEKSTLIKTLSNCFGKGPYFGGNQMNICDIAVWSVFKQLCVKVDSDLSSDMKNWYLKIDECLKDQ